jgi:Cu/Ag efflux protein CusF
VVDHARRGRASPPGAVGSLVALALLCAVEGCRGAGGTSDAQAQAVRRYTVRGEVVRLPEKPGGDLMLRHEPIDDFVDGSGIVVGMDSMVMPFQVAADASLEGLAVGDKTEVVLEVDWAHGGYRLERVKKLPPETQLRFGKARASVRNSPSSADPKGEK